MKRGRNLARSFRADDLRNAYRRARRNGWASTVDGRGHVALRAPGGRVTVRLSSTAFSGRATKAKVEELRRRGAIGRNARSDRQARRIRRAGGREEGRRWR